MFEIILTAILIPSLFVIGGCLWYITKALIRIEQAMFDEDGKKKFYNKSDIDRRFEAKAEQLKTHRSEIQKIDEEIVEIKKFMSWIKSKLNGEIVK